AGTRGVDDDLDLVGGALDLDVGDAGMSELRADGLLQTEVLMKPRRVVLVLVPLGLPGGGDAEAEAVGVRLVSHVQTSSAPPETTTVRWLMPFVMRVARPIARGRHMSML